MKISSTREEGNLDLVRTIQPHHQLKLPIKEEQCALQGHLLALVYEASIK